MQKELVSILTPCYNTGALVHRLLDSVLMQDYPSVEMFCIDDGSTDNTREVVENYIPKFAEKGYSLTYIYQENGGQSSAINNGLKLIRGEYLMWPDSDDYYNSTEAISTYVIALKGLDDTYAVVRSLPINISEIDGRVINKMSMSNEVSEENQFYNCLDSSHFIWPPVNYMIKVSAFDLGNPQREIYVEKNAGQNWQMLLPLLYSYKCKTLDDCLACVLVRESSHSRGQYKTFEQLIARCRSYKNTILSTLDGIVEMPNEERKKNKRKIIVKYKVQELRLSIQYGEKQAQSAIERELLELGVALSNRQKLEWKIQRYYIGTLLIRVVNKILK